MFGNPFIVYTSKLPNYISNLLGLHVDLSQSELFGQANGTDRKNNNTRNAVCLGGVSLLLRSHWLRCVADTTLEIGHTHTLYRPRRSKSEV